MIRDGERLDSTGFGDIKVIQKKGLGYGVDAVLLGAFAAGETGARGLKTGARVLDFGCGSGIVGFVILHKVSDSTIVGIDVRGNAVDRARRAADINGLADRAAFLQADVMDVDDIKGVKDIKDIKVDAVVSNPPYFRKSAAIPNDSSDKFTARHETTAGFGDFMRAAARVLQDGGDCYLVHRPDRLVDLLSDMRANGIEPKELQMVVPRAGEAANIVLIHGIKGAGRELKLLPELAVHDEGDGYTDTINSIYERA